MLLTLFVVGLNGIGPSTSPLSGVRSNRLSYRPIPRLLSDTTLTEQSVWELLLRRRHLSVIVKEVIQPQVPLRLPCYDFTPVINHTVAAAFPKVGPAASGAVHSHGVTGGVYKARERIHRGILIRDY